MTRRNLFKALFGAALLPVVAKLLPKEAGRFPEFDRRLHVVPRWSNKHLASLGVMLVAYPRPGDSYILRYTGKIDDCVKAFDIERAQHGCGKMTLPPRSHFEAHEDWLVADHEYSTFKSIPRA